MGICILLISFSPFQQQKHLRILFIHTPAATRFVLNTISLFPSLEFLQHRLRRFLIELHIPFRYEGARSAEALAEYVNNEGGICLLCRVS